jgi:hypothetical protein
MLSDRVFTVSGERFSQLSNRLNFPLNQPIQNVVMSTLRPIRLPRRRTPPTVESLSEQLAALGRERQDLRARDAGVAALERNRVAIARAQWELSYALIERYLPKPAAAQSAA